jgi:hypothetical protein
VNRKTGFEFYTELPFFYRNLNKEVFKHTTPNYDYPWCLETQYKPGMQTAEMLEK